MNTKMKKNKTILASSPRKRGTRKKLLDSRRRGNNKISVHIQMATIHSIVPSAALLKRWCRAALQQQKVKAASICIRLVDSRESALLNKRYRSKSGATNVLSFPADVPKALRSSVLQQDFQQALLQELGDLVICAPVVAREARAQCKTIQAHWAHMVVHGSLHLLGYDHIKKQDAVKMEALEVKILAQLGYDNPYN